MLGERFNNLAMIKVCLKLSLQRARLRRMSCKSWKDTHVLSMYAAAPGCLSRDIKARRRRRPGYPEHNENTIYYLQVRRLYLSGIGRYPTILENVSA